MSIQYTTSAVFNIVLEVEELCKLLEVDKIKRGPKPQYPDSSIITLLILKNLLGINSESALLRHLEGNYREIFDTLPERSWFNRKAKRLTPKCDEIAEKLITTLDTGTIRIPDSTPIPVVKVYRGYQSPIFPKGEYFNFGYCASKKEYYFGVKLTLVLNDSGIPVSYGITRANKHDLKALEELLPRVDTHNIIMVADKGYYDGELRAQLQKNNSKLIVPDKKRHHVFNTKQDKRLLRKRSIVESVIEQLKSIMKIHEHLAQSLEGLKARIASAILAFVFGVYHNKRVGRPLLAIKSILM